MCFEHITKDSVHAAGAEFKLRDHTDVPALCIYTCTHPNIACVIIKVCLKDGK